MWGKEIASFIDLGTCLLEDWRGLEKEKILHEDWKWGLFAWRCWHCSFTMMRCGWRAARQCWITVLVSTNARPSTNCISSIAGANLERENEWVTWFYQNLAFPCWPCPLSSYMEASFNIYNRILVVTKQEAIDISPSAIRSRNAGLVGTRFRHSMSSSQAGWRTKQLRPCAYTL